MPELTVYKYPHDILKKKAQPVTVFDEDLTRLIADMVETMGANDGVGLAAPQVGKSLCLFVAAPRGGKGDIYTFINPVVTMGNETEYGPEGCLSVPGVYNDVERARQVTVTYQDSTGKGQTLSAEGFLARIIQHEYDHLIGTLFIDRLGFSERKTVLDEYKRLQHLAL